MSQPLLEGEVEYVDSAPDSEDERIEELEMRVASLESRIGNMKRDAVVALLSMLLDSMRHIASGEMEIPDTTASAGGSKWDAIKRQMPPRHQQVVDVLLLQKAMSRKQISSAIKMNYTNCVNNVIGPLIRQGWLVDGNGMVSLKKL